MRPPIDGGTILLTGASSGIGVEMAKVLAPRARALILVARRVDRLEHLAQDLRERFPSLEVAVEPCDLGAPPDVERLVDRILGKHGTIDVLINNAGMGDVGLFELTDFAKLKTMIDVNIIGLTLLTRRFLPAMLAKGRGGILNVSSGFGLTYMPGLATYAATKHYATCLSEALRIELAGTGVVVSQLCPGPVPTEFNDVAGNPFGQKMPTIMEVSATTCAEVAIAKFSKGRAIIIPGFIAWLATTIGAATPRWLLRLAYGWMGPLMRKRSKPA